MIILTLFEELIGKTPNLTSLRLPLLFEMAINAWEDDPKFTLI
jgi:hypothetical protein